MARAVKDWFAVLDARGRLTWIIGLIMAAGVAVLEMVSAGFVAVALQLATADEEATIALPVLGDMSERLPGDDRAADLRWLVVFGGTFFVVRGAAVLFQQYFQFRSTFGLTVRLTDRIAARMLDQDFTWHLTRNSSDLSNLAVAVSQNFTVQVFAPIQALGANAIVVIGLAAVAIAAEPAGALGAVTALGVAVGGMYAITRTQLLRLGDIEITETARSQRLSIEAFQSVREVKLLAIEQVVRERIRSSRRRWAGAQTRRSTVVAAPRTVIETVAFTSLIALLAFRDGGGQGAGLSGIGVLGYAVVRILPTANNLVTHLNRARGSQASMHQLASMLERTEVQHDDAQETSVPTPGSFFPLVAEDISFSYGEGRPVLSGISLRIERGSSVGIVGATGCGKSTLLDLLIGLLPPTSGSIRLNAIPLMDIRPSWWRSLGLVPQTITLMDTTFAQNVALGAASDEIDHSALRHAVHLAELGDVVAGLPEGLNTQIGERGIRLSGGQRQRLAIARALYSDPDVIFFDEGTSALDSATEQAIIHRLRSDRPDRTLIMVAHRTSTLRDCDEILVLDSGSVVDRGDYSSLLAASVPFRQLAAADNW